MLKFRSLHVVSLFAFWSCLTLPLAGVTEANQQVSDEKLSNVAIIEIKNGIDGQLRALASGDNAKAYFVYTSQTFRQATSLSAFTQFVLTYADFWGSGSSRIDFDNPQKEGNLWKFRGILTSSQEQKLEVTYYVIKEGGRWKILGLHLTPAPLPNPNFAPSPKIV